MRRCAPHHALSPWLLALLMLQLPAGATAQIYRWVDERGTPHFGDRPEEVPPQYRDQLTEIEADLEERSPLNLIEGLNRVPARDPAAGADPPGDAAPELAFDPEAFAQLEAMAQGDGAGFQSMLRQVAGPMLGMAIAGFAVGLLVVLCFGALILMLACRICGEEPPGFLKGLGVVGMQMVAGVAVGLLFALVVGVQAVAGFQAQISQFAVGTAVNAGIVRAMVCESFGKALAVTLVVMLIGVAIGLVLVFFAMCAGGAAMLGGAAG